jgi:Neurotransmitter-gated ion-channel ligand binding domain/Neurotransmitter-gated ion-channel transmembrane region
MSRLITTAMALMVTLVCCTRMATADPIAGSERDPLRTASTEPFLLAPPKQAGAVVVRARFELHDINEINDEAETFEFAGVLTLKWHDPRQAFDPAVAGVDEKIFQGAYQFNELSPGWFPQVVLVNESGLYQKNGVVLRVQPDGTSTLIETLNATAEAEFNMRRFPFDGHRLEAVFEVLGFDRDEVLLQVESNAASSLTGDVRVPQWTITGVSVSVRDRSASYAGRRGVSSAFVVSVDVQRESFYTRRLVIIPLVVIVLLSFSVFWMDRSSLGDRLSVSFIGILTGVAYQLVMSEQLPRISYVTLMHGFLNLSFLTMCATVVINLVVGALDQRGKSELGDRIDRRCRWGFPLAYFGLSLVMLAIAMQLF